MRVSLLLAKGPVFRVIPLRIGGSLRSDEVCGVLSWHAIRIIPPVYLTNPAPPSPLPVNLTVPFEPILLVMPDWGGQTPLAGHSFTRTLTAEKFKFSLISD